MNELEWSGRSVFRASHVPPLVGDMTLEMIAEDAATKIWGQCQSEYASDTRARDEATLAFEPEDEKVASFAHSLVRRTDSARTHYEGFQQALPEFAHMVTRSIIAHQPLVYEIRFGRNPKSKGIEKVAFSLVFAPGARLLRRGRRVIQILPAPVADEYGGQRIRIPRPDDTFVFGVPKRWRKHLKRARRAARLYDMLQRRSLKRAADAMRERATCDDPARELRSSRTMLARATAALGWFGRGLFTEYVNDFHTFERAIRWERFCLDLLSGILEELQRAVERIGTEVHSPCRLVVTPTTRGESISELRRRLRTGQVSFGELIRSLR